MIRLQRLGKSYDAGATWAVRDLDLEIGRGEVAVLIGESGSGKTTTLKMINRLIEPSAGAIYINDENVLALDPVQLRRRTGYVFQQIGLFPHWDVERNVAAAPRLLRWSEERISSRVDELLELVGLPPKEFRRRRVQQLSGGQQQRVGLARALAAEPELLLMDEPFGALDPVTRDDLQEEFRSLQRALGVTAVMVTHDMTEALLLADRIAVLKGGALLRHDTPEGLMREPGDDYVRRLLHHPQAQMERLEHLFGGGDGKR